MLLSGSYLNSSRQRCSIRKVFLKILQNSQENTCIGVSFLIKLQAYGLEFSYEFYEICKCNFYNLFTEHLWRTASGYWLVLYKSWTNDFLLGSRICFKYNKVSFDFDYLGIIYVILNHQEAQWRWCINFFLDLSICV